MRVIQLALDAAAIFGLNYQDLILMLFGMIPHTLSITPHSLLSDPPTVGPGATVLVFRMGGDPARHLGGGNQPHNDLGPNATNASHHQLSSFPTSNKLFANFKLTKFDGTARSWKQWDKSFVRYLSIHQLDHVIEEAFLTSLPLSTQDFQANKMVYYLLEDSIIPASLAAKYFRQAAKWNGNEAYARLHDGYVFSGPQTMTLLLAELVNTRFKSDENASGFCLRLREIFEDLEMIPGPSSLILNDTQKIGYLLSGIRQEEPLQAVYVALQDKQLHGGTTFEEACEDLFHRCEAIRADELLDTPVRGKQKALVTTQAKRQNTGAVKVEMAPCLQKGCGDLVKTYLPLCPLHFHQCVSGKTPEIELKDGLGTAKYNPATQIIDYPVAVPKNRFPIPKSARKALVFHGSVPSQMTRTPLLLGQTDITSRDSQSSTLDFAVFYVDSGAGQCLCSCSSAFATMEACHVQVVGVSGRLNIHGQGTAMFLVSVDGEEAILRIHNCLHSFGEFNLISVSQLKLLPGNSLDFSVTKPFLRFARSQAQGLDGFDDDFIEIPLSMDDGLYSLTLEPVTPSDPRYSNLPVFDVTPPGQFVPISHLLCSVPGVPDDSATAVWTTEILSSPPSVGRVLALNSKLEFDEELRAFSDGFLAPIALPPARRQYDVGKTADLAELSIRFMGAGTDRITHTVGILNGLQNPPTKTFGRVPPKLFPQGKLKRTKTPVVAKGRVGNLHTAGIAEALSTDTFQSGDHKFPYEQAFVDHASRWGDIIPMRSRTEVGSAFVTFTCRHYTPLILISDNIAENQGGSLAEECRSRSVRQAFTCPYHPQQDRAEGYLGRITAMASFGMVFAGAPLFMWIWAIRTAVFLNNITASYFSRERIWATPYELLHGEPFPDASIVVPFGMRCIGAFGPEGLGEV
jgi:hypothetical protein